MIDDLSQSEIMSHHVSRLLHINSDDRISGTAPSFKVGLNNTLFTGSNGTHAIGLHSLHLIDGIFNVTSEMADFGRIKMWDATGGAFVVWDIKMPPGVYSPESLLSTWNELFIQFLTDSNVFGGNAWPIAPVLEVAEKNLVTGTWRIKCDHNWEWYGGYIKRCGMMLGWPTFPYVATDPPADVITFDPTNHKPSTLVNGSWEIQFGFCQFNWNSMISVTADLQAHCCLSSSNQGEMVSMVATVPRDVVFGGTIYWEPRSVHLIKLASGRNINSFQITLRDKYQRPLEMYPSSSINLIFRVLTME